MYQWYMFSVLMVVAILGSVFHWYEKKYQHLTTEDTLGEYYFHDTISTLKAFSAIVATCYTVSAGHGDTFHLSYAEFSNIGLVFMAGYGFDNKLNRASGSSTPS